MRQQNPVYIMIDCLIIEDNYAFGLDTKIKCEGLGMNVIKLITEPDQIENVLKKIGLREFIQIHRGYVINVNYIEEFNISSNQVMINNVLLPVGRSYKKSLNLLLSTLG